MKKALLMILSLGTFALIPLSSLSCKSQCTQKQFNKKGRLNHRQHVATFSNGIPAPRLPESTCLATVKNEFASHIEQEDEDTTILTQQLEVEPSSSTEAETKIDDPVGPQQQVAIWLQNSFFLGIEPTPEIWAIMTIYFVEGALGLAVLARTYLLKDELHLGPAELSALTGLFSIPWTIKPLYGFLSDGLPLFGYRRRSYLVLAGLIGCLSYTALGANFWNVLDASSGDTTLLVQGSMLAFVVSSACIAFSDVVADGIVVQRTRDSSDPKVAGGLQSLCWGSAAVGGLLSAYFSGSLLEIMNPRQVLGITAVLPFLVAAISLLIDEKPITPSTAGMENGNPSVKTQIDALWSAIKQPAIWKPALFLFLWQSTPTSDGAFFYFLTNDLGMGPEFIGRVRLVTSAAGLLGIWAYQKYLRTVPIKDILFWSSIASTPLGLSTLLLITHTNRALGIPDGVFILGDDVALTIFGQIAFLPTLVLAARLCPPGVEAVLFATLMSIFNAASTLGTEIGAGLTKFLGVTESNFDNLGLLTVICNLSSLYPLVFIGWLDELGSKSEEDIESEKAIDSSEY